MIEISKTQKLNSPKLFKSIVLLVTEAAKNFNQSFIKQGTEYIDC